MKAVHIGAFDANLGDSIALHNVKKSISQINSEISWQNISIREFWNNKNSFKFTVDRINKCKPDLVVVGGGGLIECSIFGVHETGYKLPFNKAVLDALSIPVIFYGIGVNEFRGGPNYNEKAKKHIQEIVDNSAAFSVRNDGSLNKLKTFVEINTDKVQVVPDPGLLFHEHYHIKRKHKLETIAIQPAFNGNPKINENRFLGKLKDFKKIVSKYDYIPHVKKDFNKVGKNSLLNTSKWDSIIKYSNVVDSLAVYKNIDGVIAMRGHGQLVSIGANIPGLYFSTQDKVLDFSKDNGFKEYNIDVTDENWDKKLITKIEDLKTNRLDFLNQWYGIRDKKMKEWYKLNNQFLEKYVSKFL